LRCKQLFTLARLCLLLGCASPATAHAFADATQFFPNPTVPHGATYGANGEGIYFTGAPRFASQTCASCHIDAPGRVGLSLGADPVALFADGYEPGKTYELQVQLQNETEGTQYKTTTCTDPPGLTTGYVQCNNNNFALEVDDSGGTPLSGYFCATPPNGGNCAAPDGSEESLVAPDGDAIFGNRPLDPNTPRLELRNGPKSWHLWWTAPKVGSGPVTIYVTAVDGNGGAGKATNDQDPYGDDTVAASFFIQEQGAPVPTGAQASCALVAAPARAAWPAVLVGGALVLIVLRQRRRRRV
jgi:hypothetical protein